MSERRYDPTTIEPKWQAVWEQEQTWHVSNDDAGEDLYPVDAETFERQYEPAP